MIRDNNLGINVLSLFDGSSCGQVALERSGIRVNNYFASEIDKFAEKIAHKIAKKIANRTEKEWFTLTVNQAVDILNRVGSKGIEKKKEQVQPAIQDLFSHAKTGT